MSERLHERALERPPRVIHDSLLLIAILKAHGVVHGYGHLEVGGLDIEFIAGAHNDVIRLDQILDV